MEVDVNSYLVQNIKIAIKLCLFVRKLFGENIIFDNLHQSHVSSQKVGNIYCERADQRTNVLLFRYLASNMRIVFWRII